MRFLMLIYPNITEEQYEQGVSADDVAEMQKFNEALTQAGVLLALDGLHPASKGARVTVGRRQADRHRRPVHRGEGAARRLLADRREVEGGGHRVGDPRARSRTAT